MEILKLKTRNQKTGRRANLRGWKRSGNWEAEPQTNSNQGTEKVGCKTDQARGRHAGSGEHASRTCAWGSGEREKTEGAEAILEKSRRIFHTR